MNVAWLPALSWDEAKASPGTKACLEVLRQEGHAEPRDGGVYNLSYCGFLQFMKEALGKARDLTPAGLHAAAASLPAQVGDMSFQWKVTAGRHDGAQVIRVAQYNGGEKGQWRYITGPTQVA